MMNILSESCDQLLNRVKAHFKKLYPNTEPDRLAQKAFDILSLQKRSLQDREEKTKSAWSQKDVVLITYGNTLKEPKKPGLKTLHHFLETRVKNLFSIVHILPFFPYSSDDGFSVMDYYTVNPDLGNWNDIRKIAGEYRLMADLVLNHASSRSQWFENFKKGLHPGKDYFVTVDPETDISSVVRPRTSPLLREVQTTDGLCHVWCTFSHDQVDLDFKNPNVLLEFLSIIRYYLDQGITVFRLDAVAFLWKEQCTTCLHLDQTHEIIKLLRTLIHAFSDHALIVTETNVPYRENMSYLGNGDQAHIIYNFPLPPFILYTLITGCSEKLVNWLRQQPDLLPGTTFLNFIASHDGIGLRPVEEDLSITQMNELLGCMKSFGGKISTRALNDQKTNPYEINISLWDALKGTVHKGPDRHQLARFICAHAVMLSLKGIPAFYIHSLLGTPNDEKKRKHLQSNRAINRHIWDNETLNLELEDYESPYHHVFTALKKLIHIRKAQKAFHPDAQQQVCETDPRLVLLKRRWAGQDKIKNQEILCMHNISDQSVQLKIEDQLPETVSKGIDLITGEIISLKHLVCLSPYQFLWIDLIQTAP